MKAIMPCAWMSCAHFVDMTWQAGPEITTPIICCNAADKSGCRQQLQPNYSTFTCNTLR